MIRFHPRFARHSAGFSLIELMIALVAGLIVVGAVLAFTVSSVKANSDYVKSTRLMQELRNAGDYVTSELKRAGYDEAALKYVANSKSTEVSVFAPMLIDETVNKNCVIYAYDRQPGNPGEIDLDNGEVRAIRRSTTTLGGVPVGVVEVAESFGTKQPACDGAGPDYSNYPTTCNAVSGWCPLSDPRILDVTVFTVGTVATVDSRGVRKIDGGPGLSAMQLRELEISVSGNLRNDTATARTVKANIKVRADCLRAAINPACNVAPTP